MKNDYVRYESKIPDRWEEKKALNKFNVLLHSVNMSHGVEGEISHYLVFSQIQKQNCKMMKTEHLHTSFQLQHK